MSLYRNHPDLHKKICAIAGQLGLEIDKEKTSSLYDIIEQVSGKRSLSGLTNLQAIAVVEKLESAIPKKDRYQSKVKKIKRPDIEKIEVLSRQLKDIEFSENAAEAISQRHHKKSYLKLTRKEAYSVIEALKQILAREKTKTYEKKF